MFDKMKNAITTTYRDNMGKLNTATVLLASMGAFSAHAELPAGVAEGFTQVKTDGLAMADLAWPAVISLTVAFILFKLYKRFIGKV